MVINAPSLANINLLEMGSRMEELYQAGIRFVHVDLMDGHYVPNLCFPPTIVRDIKKKYPEMTVEVHMMVDSPLDYIDCLKEYGADYVSFHMDSTHFVKRTITRIKEVGMKAGVVLNPSQNIDVIRPVAGLLDYIIFMSVEPGFAGQRFLPGSMDRLSELSQFRKNGGYQFSIMVDGGVDYENAADCIKNGADLLVTGIYIVFNQPEGIIGACKKFEDKMMNIVCEI